MTLAKTSSALAVPPFNAQRQAASHMSEGSSHPLASAWSAMRRASWILMRMRCGGGLYHSSASDSAARLAPSIRVYGTGIGVMLTMVGGLVLSSRTICTSQVSAAMTLRTSARAMRRSW